MEAMKMEQGVNLTPEGKIQSLERELDVQQSHEFLYTHIVTELQVKLSESELRERSLRECLEQAERDLQGLTDRVSALEDEKRSSTFRMEKLAREKSEVCLMLLEKDEILKESERRSSAKLLELEKEVDSLKKSRQLEKWYLDDLKTEQLKSVMSREEKLKESLAEAQRSLEVLQARVSDSEFEKRAASLIIEELRREKLEADEILKESRQRNLKAREAAEVNIERFGNVLPIAENLFKLLKRNGEDLVGMKDTLLGEGLDDRGEEVVSSHRGQERLKSESSPLLRKRLFGSDMAREFQEDDDRGDSVFC